MKIGESTGILLGFGVGAAGGVGANIAWRDTPGLDWAIRNIADPAGQIFLRLLLMVVIPLVFATLATGMSTLGGLRGLGRLGLRTLGLYLSFALIGAAIGATLVALVAPGAAMTATMRASLAASVGPATGAATPIGVSVLVNLVPVNPVAAAAKGEMLAILVFTLLFRAALASLPPARAQPLVRFLDGLAQVAGSMVRFAMLIAPVGVAGLAFTSFARFGLEFIRPLGLFAAVILASLLVQVFGIYPLLVRTVARRRALPFLTTSRPALVTGFATASSNATLPTTLRIAQERLGAPAGLASFVVPLGATLSRGGTAAFTAGTAVFLAQALGLEVNAVNGGVVVVLATVTAIAAGGIPSGVIPLLATVVAGAGVPGGAIGIILGVEPILGMARTLVNVAGALVATVVLARTTGPDLDAAKPDPILVSHAN